MNQQLSEKGLYIRSGEISIIDTSVIKAQRNRPNNGVSGENTQDSEAGYSIKAGSNGKVKTTYGFKAHINVDEDGFIKATEFTAGNVHDSQHFEPLLSGDESQVYADSAYVSKKINTLLANNNSENRLLKRVYRNTPLSEKQKSQNKITSGIRCTVERVFGILKLHHGMAQARYLGKARNQMRFNLICIAYNIRRGVNLFKEIQPIQVSCV